MIKLVVTADNDLFERLCNKMQNQSDTCLHATNVLDAHRLATSTQLDVIVVDISLHAADTLVETLHSRPATSDIPVYLVECGERVPFALRRLCTDILEADAL
jgi:DNA-binding response OmpR family regulator